MEEFIRIPISLKDQGSGSVQSGAIPTQKLKSFWWVIVRHFSCLFKLEEAVQDFWMLPFCHEDVAVAHSINTTGVKVSVFHPYGILAQR